MMRIAIPGTGGGEKVHTLCSRSTITPRVILSRFVPMKWRSSAEEVGGCDYQIAVCENRLKDSHWFPLSSIPLLWKRHRPSKPPPLSWERDLGEHWERERKEEEGDREAEKWVVIRVNTTYTYTLLHVEDNGLFDCSHYLLCSSSLILYHIKLLKISQQQRSILD